LTAPSLASARGAHVVIVGAGGNIGSHVVGQVARIPGVSRVTLIDHDRYEERNLWNQAIAPSAVGRPKVAVQAAELRRVNPAIEVQAIAARVEHLPLGALRADLILACLDGRRARMHVNEIAWRLGVPWIDAGVLADGALARLEFFAPGPDAPCMECRFSDADYRAVEQTYLCAADSALPTNAPSGLGALAAALQALECARVLRGAKHGDVAGLGPGDQAVISASGYAMHRTAHRRNAACRFDHHQWEVKLLPLPAAVETAGALFEWLDGGGGAQVSVRVAGARVVRRMQCPHCDACRDTLRLTRFGRFAGQPVRCRACRVAMSPVAFDTTDDLPAAGLTRGQRRGTLAAIGLRPGDILAVRRGGETDFIELHAADSAIAHGGTTDVMELHPADSAVAHA
jgi:adenylyltransferase/sulfurtransferase